MIGPDEIRDIISTYEKHGWVLRRLLVSPCLNAKFKAALAEQVAVVDSDIDAAWFSRPPKVGGVAWEIRYLGNPPFALLETADENAPDFESLLKRVEERLRVRSHQKR